MSSPFVERLSVELKQLILCNLQDAMSLRSAALSCRALYNAFVGAETVITTRVLLNQVDIDVLPAACLAWKAACARPGTAEDIRSFIKSHLQKRQPADESWTLSSTLPISRLHTCVKQLSLQFMDTCLAKSPALATRPPTYAETTRVERALYRFEIFVNLFHVDMQDTAPREELWRTFFSCFSPWENEQLACLHDYFVRLVAPAFNAIVEEDIAWGYFRVQPAEFFNCEYIQYILSLGLERLQLISAATTYETRHPLVYSDKYPKARFDFLHDALRCANQERSDNIFLHDFTAADEQTHIAPSYFEDSDSGPMDAWRWAHLHETWEYFVYQADRATLRQWGYVMWDRDRLKRSGTLRSPWESDSDTGYEPLWDTQRDGEMEGSYLAREIIYRSGIKGRWGHTDHPYDNPNPNPNPSPGCVKRHDIFPPAEGSKGEAASGMLSDGRHIGYDAVVLLHAAITEA
ncbi:hypothetical protein M011DRAFT_147762 [Sporormia fimetaria CBS 119925]|uniref:F-box domain-containing protein n=1 Tax=Sporormia fimetaria CBS 119925 TaxID=1340428 RepID=A0A6A6V795_9PLEO|nr:hypothetical protein M011DRAFT_147762 [Sporormia fimetaria CBS 119925]